ncbi:MAG: HIT domain-containing protein [Ramlibacter sp.]
MKVAGCPLCESAGGTLVYAGPAFRLIRVDEAGLPAFYRLVWTDHVAEYSDLVRADRTRCMDAILLVEEHLRAHLRPTKINLASLGNAVPHLHWHVIARFDWDPHYPGAVWAPVLRTPPASEVERVESLRAALETALAEALAAEPGNRTAS